MAFFAAVLAYNFCRRSVANVFGETLSQETVHINVFLVWDEEVASDVDLSNDVTSSVQMNLSGGKAFSLKIF